MNVSQTLSQVSSDAKDFTAEHVDTTLNIIEDLLRIGPVTDDQTVESNIIKVISNILDSSESTLEAANNDGKSSNRCVLEFGNKTN